MSFKLCNIVASAAFAFAFAQVAMSREAEGFRAPYYVSSQACATCHADATAKWSDSHHAWAWRAPSTQSVIGDFGDTSFTHNGVTTRFTRDGDKFLVETDGPDGQSTTYRIMGTVGVAALQQYIVETEPGRLQALDTVWDTERRRWFHLYPAQDLKAGDGLHWTGPYKNWNARCAECHATGFEKNYDPRTRTYLSRQAEIGVGCEACHGPGEAHLAWSDDPANFKSSDWQGINQFGFSANFSDDYPKAEIQQCATCHARRGPFGDASPTPGSLFADNYRLALLSDGLYHADGQILDEVYVFGSFLQSKMYARGVRCGNCHDPHSGSLIADGNAVCTQCHNVDGNPAFPSLRNAAYDALSHHHHQSGSAGAQCISCHMPERLYMVVDGRRDHSFRIPRPDLTDRIGTPNACTDCHTEKSAGWAATNVESWHPDGRSGTPHYGEVFAAARDGLDQQTQRRLLTLAGSDEFAGIVRATALDLLRPANASDVADAAAVHLGDSDAIVRAAAANLQRSATPEKRVARLARLLSDPKRSVRIEAARNLLGLPVEQYQPQAAASLKGAIREYQRSLSAKADFPESQLAIAGTALVLRNWPVAEQAFTEAVTLDPQLVDGWLMISRLQNQHGDATLALDTLQRSIVATPDNGVLRHALASQLSAVGRFESAIRQLDEAVLLLPDDPIVLADLGVLKFHLNQYHDAVQTLERAQAAGARSPEILYALTMSLLAIDDRDSAKVLALKLELLYPDSPLAEQIRQLID